MGHHLQRLVLGCSHSSNDTILDTPAQAASAEESSAFLQKPEKSRFYEQVTDVKRFLFLSFPS
jgi:hypothetical protein